MFRLILILDNESDPLELGQEALASPGPLLETITRVLDRRVVNFVAIDGTKLDLLPIKVLFVFDDVLSDE